MPWYAEASKSGTSWLTDEGFLRYATVLMWLAVISTGLGLELVLGEPLIKHLATSQSKVVGAWKIA